MIKPGVRLLPAWGLLILLPSGGTAAAQGAMTVTGHVSAASTPVRNATVRIEAFELGTTTDAEGRYSFIIPSFRVRGQAVTMTARFPRYRPQSVQISLVGGSVTQDFELSATGDVPAPRADTGRRDDPRRDPSPDRPRTMPAATAPVSRAAVSTSALLARSKTVDSTAFSEATGPTNLLNALSGRLAGVEVQSAATFAGTSALTVRGLRTVAGLTQPLIVVNGMPFDNGNITSVAQRTGGGGFDYGSLINDLSLSDVASVQLLSGPAAAMQYGGRAANGVLVVTMKNAAGLNGFAVTGSQQYAVSTPRFLPSYQNDYGQGLGGVFSFFDGKGGGLNDAVDQSWGPRLDGRAVTQASFGEAVRPEVRAWTALPNNVRDYFTSSRTLVTNLAFLGGRENGQVRVALNNYTTNGPTPESSLSRQSAFVTGSLKVVPALTVSADLALFRTSAEDRPGTGFDESNPVSVFSRMGRQVDVQAYETRLRDNALQQLSWNYAGHNNPYFAVLENDNHDSRTRGAGGGSATYALSNSLRATARVSTDRSTERRSFTVAGGWMGGFPYYLGRGDFSTGGYQNDDITSALTNVDVTLRATPASAAGLVFSVGAGRRSDDLEILSRGADKLIDTTTAPLVTWDRSTSTNVLFGGVDATVQQFIALSATARVESSSGAGGERSANVYPAVLASVDLLRNTGAPHTGILETFVLRGGWSRAGNDATPAVLQRLGITAATTNGTLARLTPEITSGFEVGASTRMLSGRLALDATYYNERSTDLIVRTAGGTDVERLGLISNKGVEATLSLIPVRLANGVEWKLGGVVGRNANVVENAGSTGTILLAPPVGGVSIEARAGSAVGAIYGLQFLRNSTGELLLRDGRPQADSATGAVLLGEGAPSWTAGMTSSVRYRLFELSVLFDASQGGRVFSASNRAGAYSGVLQETAFRPDSGLLIAGIDAATSSPNAVHISTEDYYHALGDIGERWVYDASYVKLREARATFSLPLRFTTALSAQSLRGSIIARNLATWTSAPNIDPETLLSASTFRGGELGQLPSVRSLAVQFSLTP